MSCNHLLVEDPVTAVAACAKCGEVVPLRPTNDAVIAAHLGGRYVSPGDPHHAVLLRVARREFSLRRLEAASKEPLSAAPGLLRRLAALLFRGGAK